VSYVYFNENRALGGRDSLVKTTKGRPTKHFGNLWSNYLSRVRGSTTNNNGFWIGWLDLLTPSSSISLNYNHRAIADLYTFQFTVAHELGFTILTSRILATDLSQSHCHFNSHVKSTLHRRIPFLPFLLNHLRLPSPELDPITILATWDPRYMASERTYRKHLPTSPWLHRARVKCGRSIATPVRVTYHDTSSIIACRHHLATADVYSVTS
jgi:hypothetical protein